MPTPADIPPWAPLLIRPLQRQRLRTTLPGRIARETMPPVPTGAYAASVPFRTYWLTDDDDTCDAPTGAQVAGRVSRTK